MDNNQATNSTDWAKNAYALLKEKQELEKKELEKKELEKKELEKKELEKKRN